MEKRQISADADQRHNYCSIHPNEQIIGLCGCGNFFCRSCSPSAVFCSRCHGLHQQRMHNKRSRAIAITHPGWPAHASHQPGQFDHDLSHRPSNKVILEALLLTVLTFTVIGLLLGMKNEVLSFAAAEPSISYGINAAAEPFQQDTSPFQTSLAVSGGVANIYSDSAYSISAKVESIKSYDDALGAVAPYDLLLAWGDVSRTDVDSQLSWEQSNRRGSVTGTLNGDGPQISNNYVIGHVSNNHIVPANDRIRDALASIKPGDMVKIDGRLVDLRFQTSDQRTVSVNTSKVRTDQGDGACEIIFADQIKINGKNYK